MNSSPYNDHSSIAVISSLTSYSTAGYIVGALIQEGRKVFVISDVDHPCADQMAHGAFDLPSILKKHGFKPNLVLFIEGGSMQLFPEGLEEIDCLTSWYGIDTHMDYEKHLRISRLFDVTFVAQKEYVSKLLADGINQVFWLPLACEPNLYPNGEVERIYDIGYVGSDDARIHPVRHQMLSSLQKHFPKMWSGKASSKDMGKIYAQSKLVFNKSVNNDLNMRYFEAMGAGAVLVTDPIHANGLEDLFIENEHFISYGNEEDIVQVTNNLLKDAKKIHRIGKTAQELVINKHTYSIRVKELHHTLINCVRLNAPSKIDIFSALLTMGLLASALTHLAAYLRGQKRGGVSQLIYQVTSFSIMGIALMISSIDFIKGTLRR